MTHQSYVHIRLRRDISSNWTSNNPILKVGEPGLETDTRKLKFGDGVTPWNGLEYSGVDLNDSVVLENIDDRVASLIKAGSNISISYDDNLNSLTIGAVGLQLAGDYATLVNGKIPAIQLPSYVDDVLEFANLAALPASGETNKIYVTLDSNKTYRWSGSAYVEISASPGSTDAVPEGSTNKYYTDARASAAAPVQSVAGRTGVVTLGKSDVGLANVDNTSDANKPVSTAQAAADTAVQNAASTDATTKANNAQAFAIQRSNHTGTQLANTISDFNTAVDNIITTDIVAGVGINITYDNINDDLVISDNGFTPVANLGTLSGSNAINSGINNSYQTLTLNGTSVTFTKGTGWPSTDAFLIDVILKITVTSATTIVWSIVTDWFNQPSAGALSVGTHLFLLRGVGTSVVEGHYIGSKTN